MAFDGAEMILEKGAAEDDCQIFRHNNIGKGGRADGLGREGDDPRHMIESVDEVGSQLHERAAGHLKD